MADSFLAIPILSDIEKFIRLYFERKDRKEQMLIDAVKSIQTATNATIDYLSKHQGIAPQPNTELSGLWVDAGTNLAHVNKGLSEMMLLKSEYWADPSQWDADTREQTVPSLTEISSLTKSLLL